MRMLTHIAAVVLAVGLPSLGQAQNVNWPKSLTLGTASPGGVYYVYGEAVARLLTEKLGATVNALPTQGPVHNVKLIESGGAQLGLITMGVGLQGWNGAGDWTGGQRLRKMRALFPAYDTTFVFVALRRSNISTIAQMDKLRVGIGPRAGTGGTYVPELFKTWRISPQIQFGSWLDATTNILSGASDALVTVGGTPFPAIKDLEAKEPLTFISVSPEQSEAVRKAMPELTSSVIAAPNYSSLDRPYTTLGVFNFMVGSADLPDDLVYQLVKMIHENHAQLVKAHASAKETLPENVVKNTFLPFHPGAARYYREIGIKIPDVLAPSN
jgi:TRAP transporter TAXI family solute receptor